ncbi:lithostathine-1-beta-like [Microcebus murinus]|uniref:C-type lectin domain-containing protein n=1 Tax=Microcebus murinus TaxID=30608 RepID=A0A8C5UPU3_MICMU|nr:lithostathine-1-beta-like [Microcebus murinus]
MAQTSSCLILLSCLTFLSLSQGQETQTELPNSRISCPEGTNAYRSYCYYFNPYPETWVDADLYCQNMHSGHLVSILTEAEGAFVASLIKESGTTDCIVWTGLYDPQKNRRWHWSSGSLVSYKSWITGAPSSVSPGYCGSLTSGSGYKKWKDEDCETKFSFVCKFEK